MNKLIVRRLVVKSDFVQLSLNTLLAHVHLIGQLLQRVAAQPELFVDNAQQNKRIELFRVLQFHSFTIGKDDINKIIAQPGDC